MPFRLKTFIILQAIAALAIVATHVRAIPSGDQSLFVTQDVFRRAGGFCEKHIVLEDQEIIRRIRRHANFTIIPKYITTSARKYEHNGIYRTQGIFFLIYMMYRLGYSQQSLVKTYRGLIRQDKI